MNGRNVRPKNCGDWLPRDIGVSDAQALIDTCCMLNDYDIPGEDVQVSAPPREPPLIPNIGNVRRGGSCFLSEDPSDASPLAARRR